MGTIRTSVEAGVLTLTLDNGVANSITIAMARQLFHELERPARDEEIGAVVITGQGSRFFCAGSDIGEMKRLHDSSEGPAELLQAENAAFDRLAELDIPTVAAVCGAAIGGGLELAICCDLVIASDAARFSLPEIRLGVVPAVGGIVRIPRRIGYARTMEMALTAREIHAGEALQWGLVNRLVPESDVLPAATELARRLATGPRRAQRTIKQAMRLSTAALTERETLDRLLDAGIALGDSEEVAEGLRAFFAKQQPVFSRRK